MRGGGGGAACPSLAHRPASPCPERLSEPAGSAMGAGGGLGLAAVLAAAVLCGPGALAGRVLSGECAVRGGPGAGPTRRTTPSTGGSAESASRAHLAVEERGCCGEGEGAAAGLRSPPGSCGSPGSCPALPRLLRAAWRRSGCLRTT